MKLIVKADDYGYTKRCNDGTIKAIEDGIVTVVDVMLDTPGTVDALERIKDYRWVSIGWHGGHFWGSPVADPALVPSMINEQGRFKWRKDRSLQKTVVYEEAVTEMRAELERCIRILGRTPDFTEVFGDDSVMSRARKAVCDEYGIKYGFATTIHGDTILPPAEEHKKCNIEKVDPQFQYPGAMGRDKDVVKQNYFPINHFKKYLDVNKDITYLSSWHPGYCDDYIAAESSMAYCRDIDVEALCSDELKQWIIDNKVELVNYEDAVFGWNIYQNYLRTAGSPLWKGNFS